ncbi:MAG: two-component regulator propeller domain-containing protein [Saprospiraceae bacterium]
MTTIIFQLQIYWLLFFSFFILSCSSQVNTSSTKETSLALDSIPEIIGTSPALSGQAASPLNDPSLVSQYIRCIFQDSKGNYWFGPAGQSVARYDIKTLRYFSRAEFFQGNMRVSTDNWNSVHAIAEDHQANIWFGTDFGLVKYSANHLNGQENAFRTYNEVHGLSNINIGRKCILVDKSGILWVGTGGGVFKYNLTADTMAGKCFIPFQLIPPIAIKDIMEDKSGSIWFATQDQGIFRYDPHLPNGKTIKNITGKDGLGDNYAGGMIEDQIGNFWFTVKGGICKYDPKLPEGHDKAFTYLTSKDGIGGTEIWGIYLEKPGIIWITARGSTTRFDPSMGISNPKAFTVFTQEDGINCCVQSMYQDRSGRMWWGAGAGLYRFDGKRFYQVKQKGPW